MKEITFLVHIGLYNDIEVDVEVTKKEYSLIKKYVESEEIDFYDCEELSDLYNRVIEAAYDETANGLCDSADYIEEKLGDDYDFDDVREYVVENFELCAEWPDLEEEDE